MSNLFKDMIKSKVGIILIIIFFIIGYFYIKSIFLGLSLYPIYIKILACSYVILFSLNFAFYHILKNIIHFYYIQNIFLNIFSNYLK